MLKPQILQQQQQQQQASARTEKTQIYCLLQLL